MFLTAFGLLLFSGVPNSFQSKITEECFEFTEMKNSEVTTCRGFFDDSCQYVTFIAEKAITCTNTSAESLNSYRESQEKESSYPLTLKVTESQIPVLPASTFRNLGNLTVLVLENIGLKRIMPGAFNFLHRLIEIRLGQNQLVALSEGIFNSITTLMSIDLSRNQIETIEDETFSGTNLKTLNLAHNNVSELQKELLSTLINLSFLDVSFNNLKDIRNFDELELDILILNHNSFNSINFQFLQNVSLSIDVSFNNITHVVNFENVTAKIIKLSHNNISNFQESLNVDVLDVNHNHLTGIHGGWLGVDLRQFFAGSNCLSYLSVDAFLGLSELKRLHLDNNSLLEIPNSCFKDLSSLTHLNLSGNQLTYFKFGTFDSLIQLKVLDISNNKFKKLPQYKFHSMEGLTDLLFQNNEISDINPYGLIKQFGNLKKIGINNNSWTCEKLVDLVHILRGRNISFSTGNSWAVSNIYGIKCEENRHELDISTTSKVHLENSKKQVPSTSNQDRELEEIANSLKVVTADLENLNTRPRENISGSNLDRLMSFGDKNNRIYADYISTTLLLFILCVIVFISVRISSRVKKYQFFNQETELM